MSRLGALALALALLACQVPRLAGTDLGSGQAPDFTLTDARSGSPVSLSSLRGRAVALSFLYTNCPDFCPLTAESFRQAQRDLGADADRVVFVAVSVDPAGDTPDAVRAFSRAHGLDRNWHYLIGTREQLQAVWEKYGVGTMPDARSPALVGHTDAIFLIDPQGRERSLLRTDMGAEALVNDLRVILR